MLWSRSLLLFVKEALKIWNRDVFGNVQDRVAKQRNRVVELQGMLQGDPFNQDLINLTWRRPPVANCTKISLTRNLS